MSRHFELSMGALSPSIEAQMYSQGLQLKAGQKVELFRKDADALTRCSIRGLISDSVLLKGREKLIKLIAAQVERKP